MATSRSTIYESRDLILTIKPSDVGSDHLVITFTPAIERGEQAPSRGFGEAFLTKSGYDTLCVISKSNHWWQVQDISEAIDAAALVASRYTTVSTYGVSMGGYGALLFSKRLGAQRVIAINPQFSIDPVKAPFEKRWLHFAQRLKFLNDDIHEGVNPGASIILVYDPFSIDYEHIKRLNLSDAVHLRTTFSGHATSRYLQRIGLLGPTIIDFLDGKMSHSSTLATLRRARQDDVEWLLSAAESALKQDRVNLALPHISRLQSCTHRDAQVHGRIAMLLKRVKCYALAADHFIKAHEIDADRANYRARAIEMLTKILNMTRRAKDWRGHARAIERLIAISDDPSTLLLMARRAERLLVRAEES